MTPADLDQILSFFFRPQSRISRLEFGLGTLVILFLDLAMLTFLVRRGPPQPGLVMTIVALGLPLTVAQFVLVAKRCHDLNLPGSFVLLLFVPAFNFVLLVMLAVLPGNPAPQRRRTAAALPSRLTPIDAAGYTPPDLTRRKPHAWPSLQGSPPTRPQFSPISSNAPR